MRPRAIILAVTAIIVVDIVGALLYGSMREKSGRIKQQDSVLREKGVTVLADVNSLEPKVKKSAEVFRNADTSFRMTPTVELATVALDAAEIHIANQDTMVAKLDTLVQTQEARLKLKYPKPSRVIPFVAADYEPFTHYSAVRAGISFRVQSHLRVGVAIQVANDTTVRKMVTAQYDFR